MLPSGFSCMNLILIIFIALFSGSLWNNHSYWLLLCEDGILPRCSYHKFFISRTDENIWLHFIDIYAWWCEKLIMLMTRTLVVRPKNSYSMLPIMNSCFGLFQFATASICSTQTEYMRTSTVSSVLCKKVSSLPRIRSMRGSFCKWKLDVFTGYGYRLFSFCFRIYFCKSIVCWPKLGR